MSNYVSTALFVYTEDSAYLSTQLQNNPFGTDITPVAFDQLMQNPPALLTGVSHVVVSGDIKALKKVLRLSIKYHFSVGILPAETQKDLIRFYDLPGKIDEAIDLALQEDAQLMDLILCNGTILLFKASVGRIPLIDTPSNVSRLKILFLALKKLFGLKLLLFTIRPAGQKMIKTAACGCMIIKHHRGSLASRLISYDSNINDAMVSMVVLAPISIVDYLKFLVQLLTSSARQKHLPGVIGHIKSPTIDIDSEATLDVDIDGEHATQTPLQCEALPDAVRINVGEKLREESRSNKPAKEKLNIDNLPRGKELVKVEKRNKIPFFSYASEERFRDLFTALREDASIDGIYLVLMLISTLLATVGLYLNSVSVVIGAMLLAPLMTPIVSLAMGVLRGDVNLLNKSIGKILIGVAIALFASALITLLFPHKPITDEMLARLNPTLLDLAVAVISGVAAAYSKSFREIIQSLAGVAIAVALVPPLAVAGIGIGRMDFQFFSQAFLLFATNLVGIILAATFTFRVLGYATAVRKKANLVVVCILLVLISIPLYLSYSRIVEDRVFEQSLRQNRFLVNEKYIIIVKASIIWRGDKRLILMDILAREPLSRKDLNVFKKKIQANFSKKLIIRLNTFYIP